MPETRLPPGVLHFGVQFADGREATNLDDKSAVTDGSQGPLLVFNGLSGGGGRIDFEQWLWPLPPPGPLAFFCVWSARGVTATRYELEAKRADVP